MKPAIIALFSTALACTVAPPPAAPSHENLASHLAKATVALVDDGRAYCSGVWVGSREILTAAHCVEEHDVGDTIRYAQFGDVTKSAVTQRMGTLTKVDEDHDLALITGEFLPPAHPSVRASLDDPRPGQAVCTMGHPLGLWWSFSCGEVAAVRWFDDEFMPAQWLTQSTSPVSPGNSGGGLFDERGDLLGVCHAQYRKGQNLNLYIGRRYVASFLLGVGAP